MTTEDEEHYGSTEEDCPYDCEACPHGLTAMECDDLYKEFMTKLEKKHND